MEVTVTSYKKFKDFTQNNKLTVVAGVLFSLIPVFLIIYFARFSWAAGIIADDYPYFMKFNLSGGAFEYFWKHINTHNGRFGQASLFAFLF
ncbi:hypothetical protein [Rothia sp. ZJ1223]|nr:hypothetical protein [Rothia sp. ZJ1223]MBM7051752.1 hypothetical protein [Rothia sp. ZJ1223]